MQDTFLTVLDMSIVASIAILAVLLARLLLNKAPKRFSYILWIVVLFRLLCPVSFESPFSMIPEQARSIPQRAALDETVSPMSAAGAAYHALGDVLNGGLGTVTVYLEDTAEDGYTATTEAYHSQVWLLFFTYLWPIGIAAMLIYSALTLFRLHRKLIGSARLRENIYLADHIITPFVIGVIRPKIYLPSTLSERERDYIILHERTHIRRFDHIVKLVSFLALTLHWFNPLVWLAFILSGKDMEMSCDEAVMKKMDGDIRADYSMLLLSLATGRKIFAGAPLAFGEGDTKSRIKNVMNYKKPAFWVVIATLIAVSAVCVGLATNPYNNGGALDSVAANLLQYRTEYLGNNAKVGGIISALEYPDKVTYHSFELYTEGPPLMVTVKLDTDTETRNFYTGAMNEGPFRKNAIIMFSLIHNAEYITFELDDGTNPYSTQFTRDMADRFVDGDVWSYSSSHEQFETLLQLVESIEVTEPEPWNLQPESDTSTSAAERAQAVLDSVVSGGTVAMTLVTADGVGGGRYEVPLEYGNGRNRVNGFDSSFDWSYMKSGPFFSPESVNSLKVESPDGVAAIQCWQGSNLVLCILDGESFRFSAGVLDSDAVFDGTIFTYLRLWYDEAEISGLRADIVIPDQGQSYQEIAQAWTDAYEEAMLRATPGSRFACTYVKTTASVREDSMDSWYPAKALETEHFYFDYSTVFVRENDQSNWLMAGNTVDYKGNDAPAGALEYFRMGPMYLTKEGWRCDGVGTGP